MAVVGAVWGALAPLDQTLVGLMAVDLGVYLLAQAKLGTLAYRPLIGWLIPKAAVLLMIAAGHMLDPHASSLLGPLPIQTSLSSALAGSFVLAEVVALIENASQAGVPIPDFLAKLLANVKSTVAITQAPQPPRG